MICADSEHCQGRRRKRIEERAEVEDVVVGTKAWKKGELRRSGWR